MWATILGVDIEYVKPAGFESTHFNSLERRLNAFGGEVLLKCECGGHKGLHGVSPFSKPGCGRGRREVSVSITGSPSSEADGERMLDGAIKECDTFPWKVVDVTKRLNHDFQ